MNYETLYNNIQAYAENTESLFVASIPVFVQEAEERIYNSVQIPSLRKNVTGTLTVQFASTPAAGKLLKPKLIAPLVVRV